MNKTTRRQVMTGAAAAVLAACDNSVGSNGGAVIDRRVGQTVQYMYRTIPESRQLSEKAAGMLVMPLIGEAGFFVGAGYGEGALLIDGLTVDYYSSTQASFGLQLGAQQYAHTLFFMTPEALRGFRTSSGWVGGADVEFAVDDKGLHLGSDTEIAGKSVIAFVFAQSGARIGATLAGTKYSRIIR